MRESLQYLQHVSRFRYVAREYWIEMTIALLALLGLVELVISDDAPGAPPSSLWFGCSAVAVLVLTLVARRRYPFAGPAAYWLLAAGISFVDAQLLPFMQSFFVIGMAAAFLLGNVRDPLQVAASACRSFSAVQ